ncbi:MOSC domain-containing protein [Pedobacter sp. MC2016-14]|uniref:MOSC domain-containing protein n=1 Tax=Pedobacter sp. MC2016-14 TaxID=2897327 RepID=UPI001E2C6969|nr:MOSC N-terminal beta barrel domain-containing protein [Pedobacter sp. MC2016-14]MCD0487381.1 MOSC domain-containing protein [Pedobacter sp. MC2016-14]
MNNFYLSEINVYPVKSLGGISLQQAEVAEKGLKYDRRWMLIDETGTFVSQRKHPELALLGVTIDNGRLSIHHKSDLANRVSFDLETHRGESIAVNIWDDISQGLEVSKEVSEWCADFMKTNVRLVQMPAQEKRLVDPKYAANQEIVGFADGFPFLLISQASLDGLNGKLSQPVPMDRFRPNFVFTGGDAHIEDSFDSFYLGDVSFKAVKPCARCVLTTVDQQTGLKGAEPLKTLAGYRTINKKVMFGQNLIHEGSGFVNVGDELKMVKRKS